MTDRVPVARQACNVVHLIHTETERLIFMNRFEGTGANASGYRQKAHEAGEVDLFFQQQQARASS
ncbi:hypothetical protein [Spirosoma fluviale]|uniref:hypothetical protein n=1 Tax=Spirosoma fluviale TaxID=1597977 RepID=UPI000BE472FF|nr:hypothetical protein [Spirosoma fluviale]